MNKKIYTVIFLLTLVAVGSFSFSAKQNVCNVATKLNSPGGIARYTGASWDNGGATCSNCHSGGSYNPTTTLSLLSGTTPVTQYTPGTAYTLQIKITSSSGAPKYGFCAMCATTTANTNINGWGTMPTGVKNATSSSRNYLEQSSARSATGTSPTSYYTVNIPWTAPVAGTGSVTFYAAGMAVNGTGGTSGDSPTPGVNLTIPELNTSPVTMSSFIVNCTNQNNVLVQWKTEQEVNTSYFEVQRSTDGYIWKSVATINAKGNTSSTSSYSFSENAASLISGKIYYRIKTVDINGAENYSSVSTIFIKSKAISIICKSAMPLRSGELTQYDINADIAQEVNIVVSDMSGKIIHSSIQKLYPGTNSIQIMNPAMKGIYAIKFTTKEFEKTFHQIIQ